MPRDGLEPTHRLGEERERRHRDDRHAVVERPEPRADQAHVVVQRQPRDADVVAGQLEGLAEGADVGEQVGVRQRHALRRARAPRRVLDQRQRIRGDDSGVQVDSGVVSEVRHGRHRGQGRRERAQERGGALGLGERQQDAGARVAQDRGLARGVLLDLIGAERRVERHGDAAGEQDAHVGVEERRLGAEQQRDALARRHAAVAQAGGHAARVAIQAAVRDQRLAAVVVAQLDVDALGAALDLPAQRLDQRPRGRGRTPAGPRVGRGRGEAGSRPGGGRAEAGRRPGVARGEAGSRPGLGPGDGRRDLARRIRLGEHRLAQLDAGGLLEAHRQLDSLEAAQRQLARQRLVRADRGTGARRVDLDEQAAQRVEDERDMRRLVVDAHATASCIARHVSSTCRRSVVGAPIATRTIQRPSRTAAVR